MTELLSEYQKALIWLPSIPSALFSPAANMSSEAYSKGFRSGHSFQPASVPIVLESQRAAW